MDVDAPASELGTRAAPGEGSTDEDLYVQRHENLGNMVRTQISQADAPPCTRHITRRREQPMWRVAMQEAAIYQRANEALNLDDAGTSKAGNALRVEAPHAATPDVKPALQPPHSSGTEPRAEHGYVHLGIGGAGTQPTLTPPRVQGAIAAREGLRRKRIHAVDRLAESPFVNFVANIQGSGPVVGAAAAQQ